VVKEFLKTLHDTDTDTDTPTSPAPTSSP